MTPQVTIQSILGFIKLVLSASVKCFVICGQNVHYNKHIILRIESSLSIGIWTGIILKINGTLIHVLNAF